MKGCVLLAGLMLLARVASAQPRNAQPQAAQPRNAQPQVAQPQKQADPKERVVYKKRTIIDFTGALIEGDLIKPEGSYVVSRKASRFSTLIRIRENFLPELIASPNDL